MLGERESICPERPPQPLRQPSFCHWEPPEAKCDGIPHWLPWKDGIFPLPAARDVLFVLLFRLFGKLCHLGLLGHLWLFAFLTFLTFLTVLVLVLGVVLGVLGLCGDFHLCLGGLGGLGLPLLLRRHGVCSAPSARTRTTRRTRRTRTPDPGFDLHILHILHILYFLLLATHLTSFDMTSISSIWSLHFSTFCNILQLYASCFRARSPFALCDLPLVADRYRCPKNRCYPGNFGSKSAHVFVQHWSELLTMIKYVTSIFWFMKENNEKRCRFDELKKK